MAVFESTAEPVAGNWIDRWSALRDRLLSSHRFRRWAARFPLTRSIARRRARDLFDLCGGFVYSQVLFACVQLGLFDILSERPQSAAELAPRLLLSTTATERLLAAAIALRLVSRRSDARFGLGALGTAMIDNHPVTAMVRHHAMLYGDLQDPVALLRGQAGETALSRYWAYARSAAPVDLAAGQIADYTNLMAASQAMIAEEILDAYPLGRHKRLLDVGGGNGAFLTAALSRTPGLEAILFDLPPVAEQARLRLVGADMQDRIEISGGDFLSMPLPRGADIASLVRVLHDHDDASAIAVLRAIREVLPADGVLLVAEPMSGTPGAEPVGDAYFGFYLLAMGSGRPRLPEEIGKLLREAGFRTWRMLPTTSPLVVRLILAER